MDYAGCHQLVLMTPYALIGLSVCHSPGCAEIGYVDHTGCHMDHTVRHQLVTSATKSVPYHAVRQDLRGDAVAVEAQVLRALGVGGTS
jgi:hypothetical protein